MIDLKDTRQVMAATMWGEARGEGGAGMQAVACVIGNRAKHPRWWGLDERTVCLKPYQFSCWLEGDPNREKMLALTTEDPIFNHALALADLALHGNLVDTTHGADSYYAAGTPEPDWAKKLTPVAVIGHHRFYRTEI